MYSKISNIIELYEERALSKMQVLDYAPNVLRMLAKKYHIYIATMQSKKIVKRILNILGDGEYYLRK